jgi:hypothetical protein
MKRWFNRLGANWRDQAVGIILSVTLAGVTVLWIGALVWLGIKFWP